MNLLIIEDEKNIANSLKIGFMDEGFSVDLAYDGEDGYDKAAVNEYDSIILDLMLPGMDGIEVCKKLREEKVKTPIIMLTARDAINDRVKGLQTGADDYMVKPFSFEELLARVKSLIRRSNDQLPILKIDNLTLDPIKHIVTRKGKEISLTAKEYNLLEFIMNHTGQILTRDQIINHVWDYNFESFTNPVDVFINRLRNKIETDFPKEKKLIHTVRGLGYKMSVY